MLKYDTIKIKTNNKYLIKTVSTFNKKYNPNNGLEVGKYYSSKDSNIPFNIFVGVDYLYNKLTIEFSSKILLEKYPLLINKNTISECLHNLEKLNVCKVDVNNIIKDSVVTSLDVTKDIDMVLDENILNTLNTNVSNYRRFGWRHYENEGIVFTSDVKSYKDREQIKIYNKFKEITATEQNRRFLNMLSNKNDVIYYFDGKTRFEVSLKTPAKIKSYFNIEDTYLQSVLNAKSNPILTQFDKVFDINKPIYDKEIDNYEDFAMECILKRYDNDMKMVQQELRNLYDSRSGVNDRMKKMRVVKDILNNGVKNSIINDVRTLLC